jgi:hypothetical protein
MGRERAKLAAFGKSSDSVAIHFLIQKVAGFLSAH